MTPANPHRPKKTLLHNLGEFFGHIAQGIKSDPHTARSGPSQSANSATIPPQPLAPSAHVIRQETQEHQVLTPQGKLVLRRTIIDEVRRADDRS